MAEDDTVSTEPMSRPSAEAQRSKGTFLPLIFGGALATALGFFAAQLDGVEQALGLAPQDAGWQEALDAQAQQVSQQSATITEQANEIAALSDQLANLPEPEPAVDLSGVEQGISAAQEGIAAAQTKLDDLAERLTTLEKRPMTEGLSKEAIAAYEAELEALRGTVGTELENLQGVIASQRDEISELIAEAKATESEAELKAQAALARAALSKVITSIDSGAPFADALADLNAVGDVDVPPALESVASDGAPTLAVLQQGYPDAARAALAAARKEAADAGARGIGSFLQRQLGARSVAPKEGNDPDAILSRTEVAVRAGQLGTALEEIAALPDTAQAAMSDWTELATTRHAATTAAQDLMSALRTN